MSAFISLEIEADAITEAMCQDANFTKEVWEELAVKLDMGLLLDDGVDVLSEHPKLADFVATQLEGFALSIRDRIDHATLAKETDHDN